MVTGTVSLGGGTSRSVASKGVVCKVAGDGLSVVRVRSMHCGRGRCEGRGAGCGFAVDGLRRVVSRTLQVRHSRQATKRFVVRVTERTGRHGGFWSGCGKFYTFHHITTARLSRSGSQTVLHGARELGVLLRRLPEDAIFLLGLDLGAATGARGGRRGTLQCGSMLISQIDVGPFRFPVDLSEQTASGHSPRTGNGNGIELLREWGRVDRRHRKAA